jgi:outer membrane protein TolC
LALANKEFFPDFELVGRYDSFWQPVATQGDLRAQAGVNMNVPIYLEKRRAAVREAMFKLNQQRAECGAT